MAQLTHSEPLERRIAQLEAISALSGGLIRAETEKDVLEEALDALFATVGPDRAAVLLFDAQKVMRFRAWRGLSEKYRRLVDGHTPWRPESQDAEPIAVADAAADPSLGALRDIVNAEGIRALAFVPLLGREGVIGKFMLYSDTPRTWSEEDLSVAELVARHVAIGIDRVQQRQALNTSRDEIRRERNLLVRLFDQLPVAAVVAEAPSGRLLVVNDRARQLWPDRPVVNGADDYSKWSGERLDGNSYGPSDWPLFRALRAGESVDGEEIVLPRPDAPPRRMLVSAAPIRDEDGRIVAAVTTFDDVTRERRREESSRFLAEAGRILVSSIEHEKTLQAVARLAVPVIADWCAVDLLSESGELKRVAVAHRDPEKMRWAEEVHRRFPPDLESSHGIGGVLKGRGSTLYPEITEEMLVQAARDEEHLELLRKVGFCSGMIVPLRSGETPIGALTFVSAESDRRFDQADLELAEELSRRASLAITNSLLFQREKESRRSAEALQLLAQQLSEAATPTAVARVVIAHAHETLGGDASSLALVDPTGSRLLVASSIGYDPTVAERWKAFPIERPTPLSDAVRSGEIVVIESSEEMAARYPDIKAQPGFTMRVAIPMVLESRVIGGIGLSFTGARVLDAATRELMMAFGRQSAQALERARLFEAEQRARAEAEAANRSKDDFLATLSHELRTPLTATLGWARMLTLTRLDEEGIRVAAESIHRSAQAQARIVDDLLEVSRIITGKMRLETQPVDLLEIVESAIASVRSAADAKDLRLTLTAARPSIIISADPDRMRQVIWNLLSNAIKFTQKGGHIDVRADRSGSNAVVVVRDDGQGIHPEFLPHVFERFRQWESGSSRSVGGLGLGLAIVRHLVELHGGEVSASSEGVGKGAEFTITIPALERGASAQQPGLEDLPAGSDLAGIKLLLVEDEDETRFMLRTILERFGAEVTTASSADEALTKLDGTHDVLVSDLAMPGMDGTEFIATVRSAGDSAALPAIALTAFGQNHDRERALEAGFDSYLRKPVEPERLVAAILEVLPR